jgi:hypothetical protein
MQQTSWWPPKLHITFGSHLHNRELNPEDTSLGARDLLVQHTHSDASTSAKPCHFLPWLTAITNHSHCRWWRKGRSALYPAWNTVLKCMEAICFTSGPPGSLVVRIFVSRSIGREWTIDRYTPHAGLLIRTMNAPAMLGYCRYMIMIKFRRMHRLLLTDCTEHRPSLST